MKTFLLIRVCLCILAFFVVGGVKNSRAADFFADTLLLRPSPVVGVFVPERDLLTCRLLWCTDLSIGLFGHMPPTKVRWSGGSYYYVSFGEQESAVWDGAAGRFVSWTCD